MNSRGFKVDTTGLPVTTVPGGVLIHVSDRHLIARADGGGTRTHALNGQQHVNTMRRNAENYLRRAAGLPTLPKCCAVCGNDVLERSDPYCSAECIRVKMRRGHEGLRQYEDMTPEEFLAQLEQIYALRSPGKQDGGHDGRTHKFEAPTFPDAHGFASALALADRLIRAKGGTVPTRQGFTRADVADAHERALARRAAKRLKATA